MFWFSFGFHHNKVTTWNKGIKNQLSSRVFLGFSSHLKLPQYLELLKWGKIALLFSQKACFKESAFSNEKWFVEIPQQMLFLRALSLVLLMLPFCVEGVGSPQPSQEMFVAISSDKGNMTFGPGFLCWASHFPETSEDATYYYYFFFSLFPLSQALFFTSIRSSSSSGDIPVSQMLAGMLCISPADTSYPAGCRMKQTPPLFLPALERAWTWWGFTRTKYRTVLQAVRSLYHGSVEWENLTQVKILPFGVWITMQGWSGQDTLFLQDDQSPSPC